MDIPLPSSKVPRTEYSPSQVTSPQSDDDSRGGSNSKSNSPRAPNKSFGSKRAEKILKFLKVSKKSTKDDDVHSQDEETDRQLFASLEKQERQDRARLEREKKLNIETIIEEETNEKKMIPKMDAMPNKAGSSYHRMLNAAGPVEMDILNRQRAEEEALKRAATYQVSNIKCDNFGFVTAQVQQPIIPAAKKDRDRDRDRNRDRDRRRSRSRSRDRGSRRRGGSRDRERDREKEKERELEREQERKKAAEKRALEDLENLKSKYSIDQMPTSWATFKSIKLDLCHPDVTRLKKAFKDFKSEERKVMFASSEIELDAVVVENEHALNKKFKAQVVETKTIEYPAKAIKTTKASPNIEWCMNPQQYSSDEFKGRQDFPELIETIKSLENSKSSPKTISKTNPEWFVRSEDFLTHNAKGAVFEPKKAKKTKIEAKDDLVKLLQKDLEDTKKDKKAKKKKKKKDLDENNDEENQKRKKKKKKKAKDADDQDSTKKVKKAKKSKKAKDEDLIEDFADPDELVQKPLTSKLMNIAGYTEGEEAGLESSPKGQRPKKRKREDPRSPSPPPPTIIPAKKISKSSTSSKVKPPRTPPEPDSPPTDPRLRLGRPSGPRTPSPRNRSGPRTPSPRRSPMSPLPRDHHYKSRSPPPASRRGGRRTPPYGSPKRRRSPNSSSPKRMRGRSPSSPVSPYRGSRGRRGHSPHSSPRYSRSRYNDSHPSFRLERSVADSTINDADLVSRAFADSSYYSAAESGGASSGLFSEPTHRLNSPKRPSLDERLEKELGIKVRDAGSLNGIPDFSKPPPGYPIIPPQINQNDSAASAPEEGRLVRVGNMLQIVPESKTATIGSSAAPSTAATANLTPPIVPTAPQASLEEQKAKELLKKLEEQRKRKEEERKKRREARMAEQQKKQLEQEEQHQQQQPSLDPPENKKSEASGGRILETIEREEDKEARILAEAITAVPEPDSDQEGEEDIQSFNAERRSKSKKKDDIRYISLKPLSKKERKRQQRLMESENNEDAEEIEESPEDFVKRSPVPLPDASTCKPILHQYGYNKAGSQRKILRYADNVIPGDGSPDHHHNTPAGSTSPPSANNKKRRKKIRVMIIETKGSSDSEDDDAIPGPPPGSPKLYHTAEFIQKFASQEFRQQSLSS